MGNILDKLLNSLFKPVVESLKDWAVKLGQQAFKTIETPDIFGINSISGEDGFWAYVKSHYGFVEKIAEALVVVGIFLVMVHWVISIMDSYTTKLDNITLDVFIGNLIKLVIAVFLVTNAQTLVMKVVDITGSILDTVNSSIKDSSVLSLEGSEKMMEPLMVDVNEALAEGAVNMKTVISAALDCLWAVLLCLITYGCRLVSIVMIFFMTATTGLKLLLLAAFAPIGLADIFAMPSMLRSEAWNYIETVFATGMGYAAILVAVNLQNIYLAFIVSRLNSATIVGVMGFLLVIGAYIVTIGFIKNAPKMISTVLNAKGL